MSQIDGGDGGNVYVVSDENVSTLKHVDSSYRGNAGHRGSGNFRGRCGADVVIRVPVGTVIEEQGYALMPDHLRDLDARLPQDDDPSDRKSMFLESLYYCHFQHPT